MPVISVILPTVSDGSKLKRFCSSLFSGNLDVELLICSNKENTFSQETTDRIKVISAETALAALTKAIFDANGRFIIFADESVTFAESALEKMIVYSNGNSAACNVGVVSYPQSNKAFSENFAFDELASKPYVFNHLLSADVIRSNSLMPCGADVLSLMLFVADYYRYDNCSLVNEVLMYTDGKPDYSTDMALDYITGYSEVFALTQNVTASIFFLRTVFTALLNDLKDESFETLKSVTQSYKDDFAVLAWLRSTFDIDTAILCDEMYSYAEFKYNGNGVFYKEVSLPVTADSVVRNFYFGKFGIDVLKKCIGAWGYYKFYRMKDGPVKKYGCMVFKRLLGGDFDA